MSPASALAACVAGMLGRSTLQRPLQGPGPDEKAAARSRARPTSPTYGIYGRGLIGVCGGGASKAGTCVRQQCRHIVFPSAAVSPSFSPEKAGEAPQSRDKPPTL